MKNLFFTAILLSLTITSCSEKKEQVAEQQPTTESNTMMEEPKPAASADTASTTAAAKPEDEGKALVEGADCLSCHKVDSKLVGPAYQDVAAKYTEADIDHLAQKVIDGGKGVWGDIPMTPHAGLSKENAQKMVKYILSLKK
ncbi:MULTISPECIES: c-type cytochrome [Chryseobacterium]|uniref:Cytochrome c551 n=2 Tax=Chryseobacterium gleum TaxID=250 RepID=A0A3S4M4Y5_CHRGE|nr:MULTISPECIES: c-type cytochrome [Chryseobacterium]AZB32378.1 cytochrome C [Chryseobacterium bernardetii]EFK34153.1 cytochrome C [Chryseobacterium gleum ATCC 35910]MDG4654319.1 c-type cytochrome [Chryseobacterium arthrosphaerae]QQY30030.1 c-type cytochrome [Chryseobacterium gleum]TLX26337.1 c-type cytochrome [Chryseobacterium indologenes]